MLAALALGGCASLPPPLSAPNLVGEWRFAYVQKARTLFGENPGPPAFDTVEFRTNGDIRLVDSMMGREFAGTYTLTGDRVTWRFSPAGTGLTIEHVLDCAWAAGGRGLMLRIAKGQEGASTEAEYVYVRSSRLLPTEEVAGRWVTPVGGRELDMSFGTDGTYHMDGRTVWAYYRLWPSTHGNAMTTAIWVEGRAVSCWCTSTRSDPASST